MSKFYVTTPIYYVNAKPHIGHIYATMAADVLARFHRKQGHKVLFSTGVDENSQKNVEAAEKMNKEPQAYVDEMAEVWQQVFSDMGLTHDVFIRTTSKEHEAAVQTFLGNIKKDDIYLGEYEGFYCVGCESFIAEKELVDGKCPDHAKEPKVIKEKNYFFRLSNYRDQLLKYYEQNPTFVQPSSARNKMLHYIEHEMEDISISRQAQDWGIRMPQDSKHAVYVWFDALINYLTATGYPDTEKSKEFWPADIHVIGKDIIKFHCAIWPAMLMSAKLPLPHMVFAHGFFTVDGSKISKSLGNAIDPLELAKEYPIDAIRYYLLKDIPFGSDGDFSHERLHDRYNADLANGLGNLVSRTLNMMDKFYPDFDKTTVADNDLPVEVLQPLATVEVYVKDLAFDKALQEIWKVIGWADELIERKKPWALVKDGKEDEAKELLAQLYLSLVKINENLYPFMPETYKKLKQILESQPLEKPSEPLFARK